MTNYFNENKPILEEILADMKSLGYPEDAIEYARIQIMEKKDLNFAMNLTQIINSLKISKQVFSVLQDDEV